MPAHCLTNNDHSPPETKPMLAINEEQHTEASHALIRNHSDGNGEVHANANNTNQQQRQQTAGSNNNSSSAHETTQLPPMPDGPLWSVLYDYDAKGEDELTLRRGQIVVVLSMDSNISGDEGWWTGKIGDKVRTNHCANCFSLKLFTNFCFTMKNKTIVVIFSLNNKVATLVVDQ